MVTEGGGNKLTKRPEPHEVANGASLNGLSIQYIRAIIYFYLTASAGERFEDV